MKIHNGMAEIERLRVEIERLKAELAAQAQGYEAMKAERDALAQALRDTAPSETNAGTPCWCSAAVRQGCREPEPTSHEEYCAPKRDALHLMKEPVPCCERDTNGDGDCDRHPRHKP